MVFLPPASSITVRDIVAPGALRIISLFIPTNCPLLPLESVHAQIAFVINPSWSELKSALKVRTSPLQRLSSKTEITGVGRIFSIRVCAEFTVVETVPSLAVTSTDHVCPGPKNCDSISVKLANCPALNPFLYQLI